ncbi:hypothetical protein N7461_004105 [Penicillium sp. DV-2018c]|nr:hypothetical protein N7461_004105 [Penicillium sp. DV-2018c]
MAGTYLTRPAIADLITTYEQDPTPANVKNLVKGLIDFAFTPKEKWDLKEFPDEERNHHNYFVMKNGDNGKTLHTIIKISFDPEAAYDNQWDLCIPVLSGAPMENERCWALLVRGLKVRLYEYHREEQEGHRLVPCDFKLAGKWKHTVHIRKNSKEVQTILTCVPTYLPEEYGDDSLKTTSAQGTRATSLGLGN